MSLLTAVFFGTPKMYKVENPQAAPTVRLLTTELLNFSVILAFTSSFPRLSKWQP